VYLPGKQTEAVKDREAAADREVVGKLKSSLSLEKTTLSVGNTEIEDKRHYAGANFSEFSTDGCQHLA
ncbi:hypothetical protein Hamer_G001896, partial [Homarus americanus]